MIDLDAALAEKLGWEVDENDGQPTVSYGGGHFEWLPLQDMSKTWGCAGLIVEAMRKRGLGLVLSVMENSVAAEFLKDKTAPAPPTLADTAPLAIRDAALAALEGNDGPS